MDFCFLLLVIFVLFLISMAAVDGDGILISDRKNKRQQQFIDAMRESRALNPRQIAEEEAKKQAKPPSNTS